MSNLNFKQYQININGNLFEISSPHGELHIREVEKFLNNQIDEVNKISNTMGQTNLAYLVALNLADDLLKIRKKQLKYENIEQNLTNLYEKLEKAVKTSNFSEFNSQIINDMKSNL